MKLMRSFFFVLFFIGATGCQKKPPPPDTTPKKDPYLADYTPVDETLVIQTVPSGAKVTLSSGETCKSPCKFPKKNTDSIDIRIEKQGYRAANVTVVPHASVVPGSGASGHPKIEPPRLVPNPVRVTLEPSWTKR